MAPRFNCVYADKIACGTMIAFVFSKCKWWDGCKYCTRRGGGWDLEYCDYDWWNNDYGNHHYGW
jgi:hypothetical protein